MKYILTLICLFSTFINHGQQLEQDNLSLLLEGSKAIESTRNAFGVVIQQQAAKTKSAPINVVDLIQKKIDYEGYRKEIKDVFNSHYSTAEIDELLEIYLSGDMELYKEKTLPIADELYKLGSDFGRNSMKIIIDELKKY